MNRTIGLTLCEATFRVENRHLQLLLHYGPRERSRRRTTKLQEIGISENDLWIAASALYHSFTVVSADRDFERMQQV